MQVPRDDQGRPRFSITQFRAYGAVDSDDGDVVLDVAEDEDDLPKYVTLEEPRGCPLKYRLRYQDRTLPPREEPVELLFGRLVHRVLHVMERDSIGPDEALEASWDASLPFRWYDLARRLLAQYMARESPLSMYATLAVERRFLVELYVDEEFGPVMFESILDWIGADTVYTDVLHFSDYKTDQRPPARAAVEQDPQIRSQQWVLEQPESWRTFGYRTRPRIVAHLDALRWRDFEVPLSRGQIEAWHRWAVATARSILRDRVGAPRLNPGCSRCEAQSVCPLWKQLPGEARTVAMRQAGDTVESLSARRRELALVKKLVGDEYAAVMAKLNDLTRLEGEVTVGDQVWTNDGTNYELDVDWPQLQRVLGSRFWDVIRAPMTAIEAATEDNPAMRAAAEKCIRRVPVGRKIRRKKVTDGQDGTGGTTPADGSSAAASPAAGRTGR